MSKEFHDNIKSSDTSVVQKKGSTFFSPFIIQPKLKVGTPNDKYEIEADRVADQVVSMPDANNNLNRPQTGPVIQKKCTSCSEDEKLQKKPLSETITPVIQKAPAQPSSSNRASDNATSKINETKGSGKVMDGETQDFMESRFDSDFSQVNIHTDDNATQLNNELNAKAFTVGNDIYFNEGQYEPHSYTGKHLLAHELTHTIQQNGLRRKIQKKDDPLTIETTNDAFTNSAFKDVNELGIVYQSDGANLRNKPLPEKLGSKVIRKLKQNEKVYILSHDKKGRWYAVTTDDGLFGYIADWLIWKKLPEPNVKVLKIPSGSTALEIASTHYGNDFKSWGSDLRFVVNALAFANDRNDHNGVGSPGISKKNNDQSWAKTKVNKDVYIWLPSVAFLNSLKGKVSSGSITYEIWEGIKAAASAIAFGASFVAGVLHGALAGLVALIKGLIDLFFGAIKSILFGTVWSDLKNIWTAVTSMGAKEWKELFFGWMDPWLINAQSSNPFVSGHAYGYITGRILFEIIMLFVGGAAIVKVASKLGKLASKLSKLKVLEKLSKGVKGAGGKIKESLAKLKKSAIISKIHNFNTTKMLSQYVGEHLGQGWVKRMGTKVTYLDEAGRTPYELFIKNGKLYDVTGKLFDTSAAGTIFNKGKAIFVMGKDGRIFASKTHAIGKFHHSSFFGGKPVASAGELVVSKGVLKEVTRSSGHYKPTAAINNQMKIKLRADGIDPSSITFSSGF